MLQMGTMMSVGQKLRILRQITLIERQNFLVSKSMQTLW